MTADDVPDPQALDLWLLVNGQRRQTGTTRSMNCGTILDGGETVQEAGQRIFELILRVASGERTKSELSDFGAAEFAPWPLGATV